MMGGSHVETSSICAIPLGIVQCPIWYMYAGESGAALVNINILNETISQIEVHVYHWVQL